MRIAPMVVLVALFTVGPAVAGADSRDARALSRELAGRTPGPAQRCVSNDRLNQSATYGNTLLYRDGRTVWLNQVKDCPALRRDPILIFDVFGSQLCENDLIRTAERGAPSIPGPICQLGKFTPYRKAG